MTTAPCEMLVLGQHLVTRQVARAYRELKTDEQTRHRWSLRKSEKEFMDMGEGTMGLSVPNTAGIGTTDCQGQGKLHA